MLNSHNHIHFYNDPDNEKIAVAAVKLSYVDNSYPIQEFLSGDIQLRERNCSNWIEKVISAEKDNNFFYDSFGNCCTTTITHDGVTIENEYMHDMASKIKLSDMKIILEKWMNFIINREEVEFDWEEKTA
jgi:hypothetical protein